MTQCYSEFGGVNHASNPMNTLRQGLKRNIITPKRRMLHANTQNIGNRTVACASSLGVLAQSIEGTLLLARYAGHPIFF